MYQVHESPVHLHMKRCFQCFDFCWSSVYISFVNQGFFSYHSRIVWDLFEIFTFCLYVNIISDACSLMVESWIFLWGRWEWSSFDQNCSQMVRFVALEPGRRGYLLNLTSSVPLISLNVWSGASEHANTHHIFVGTMVSQGLEVSSVDRESPYPVSSVSNYI